MQSFKIKPLVWDGIGRWCDQEAHYAECSFGVFSVIDHRSHGNGWRFYPPWDADGDGVQYPEEQAAKAAAQADYEKRILSALEPAPVGVEEAARVLLEAWEKHGEGLHGRLSCYALEGEEGEPFEMVPDIDGGWVKFHEIESALRALSGEVER